jgi:hypothetical protein
MRPYSGLPVNLAMVKLGYQAILLPKLNVIVVDKLPCRFNRAPVVGAIEQGDLKDMAVVANGIKLDNRPPTPPAVARSPTNYGVHKKIVVSVLFETRSPVDLGHLQSSQQATRLRKCGSEQAEQRVGVSNLVRCQSWRSQLTAPRVAAPYAEAVSLVAVRASSGPMRAVRRWRENGR